MIIRTAVTCDMCGKLHVVRIGMGQEEHQSHRFPCRQCGEEMGVGLNIDYVNVTAIPVTELNCTFAKEEPGAEIVNVEANFVIPPEYQGRDKAFPRMDQILAMAEKAAALGVRPRTFDLADPKLDQRPYRRPDYNAEWSELRRAWTLHRRGQDVLARGVIKKASAVLYPEDPLHGLADWVWRLTLHFIGGEYYPPLDALIERLKPLRDLPTFDALYDHYAREMVPARGRRYLSVLTEYFRGYSEFAQVQFLVTAGTPPAPGDRVTSLDFERTRMFYGNAFEAHADLVDLIAMLNNLKQGRAYDTFAQLTLEQYYRLDKSGRSNCFAMEPDFARVSTEADNQIRNASHHGGMDFDPTTQIITYRAGKGGTGPEQQMSYTEYLVRCVRITMQIANILQLGLLMSPDRPPL